MQQEDKLFLETTLKKCWNLNGFDKTDFDNRIYKNVLKKISNINTDNYFLVYWSRENEPDTMALIDELLANNKKICLLGFNKKGLKKFYEIKNLNFKFEWIKNLKVPLAAYNKSITVDKIACIIIPSICFDENNNTLVYSSNILYNDLINFKKIISIGLAYSFGLHNGRFLDKTMKLNFVVTEKE